MTVTAAQARSFGKQKFERIPAEEVPLTVQQEQLWEQTRVKFLNEAPGFCFILYQMMNGGKKARAVFSRGVPIAATDGVAVMFNPDTYFKYTLAERVFILGHEVCHAILNHPITYHMYRKMGVVKTMAGGELPYDERTMQLAGDYIINDMLVQSKIGACPADDPKTGKVGGKHDPKLIQSTDNLITAYEKLWKKQGGEPQEGKPGEGQGSGQPDSMDQVLPPGAADGKAPEQAQGERNAQEWKTAVASAMANAKAQGKLPAAMQRMFEEVLEPRVDWTQYITGFFQRKLGGGAYNFRRPDRRMISRLPDSIYAPARSGFGAEVVVLVADSSGSIGNKTVAMWMGEVAGVLQDVRPRDVYLIWCDAKVQRVTLIEDMANLADERRKGAPGNGGTSFVPPFEWVEKMGLVPDALLYLTDMYGTFPSRAPSYPVLWGSISPGVGAPFGEVVEIPNADK